MAMLLAFASPEIEVLGVTTVAGNVPLELTTKNALKLSKNSCVSSFFHQLVAAAAMKSSPPDGGGSMRRNGWPAASLRMTSFLFLMRLC